MTSFVLSRRTATSLVRPGTRLIWPCWSMASKLNASKVLRSTSPIVILPPAGAVLSLPTHRGHEQYTCNMVTGASTAEPAILPVDARKGLLP
jgi:hypothetical protein